MKRREFLGTTAAAPLAAVPLLPKTKNPNNVPVVQFGEPRELLFAGAIRKMSPVLNAEEIFANSGDWDSHGFKLAHAWVNEKEAVYNSGPPGSPVRVIWGELRLTLHQSGTIYFDAVTLTGGKIEEARKQEAKPAFCYYPDPNGNNRLQSFQEGYEPLNLDYDKPRLPIIKLGDPHLDFMNRTPSIVNAKEIFEGVEWCGDTTAGEVKIARATLRSQDAIGQGTQLVWGEMTVKLYRGGCIRIVPTQKSVRISLFEGFAYNEEMKEGQT